MNEIEITTDSLPVVNYADCLAAAAPFYHADRIAPFNVLIYVTEGQINVTEDNTDYEIKSGELLFLKSGVHHFGRKEIAAGTEWYYVHFFTQNSTAADCRDYDYSRDADTPPTQDEKMLYRVLLPKKLTGLRGTALENEIRDFTTSFHSPADERRWRANSRLFKLLSDCAFFERYSRKPTLAAEIAEYLCAHINEKFSAEALEKHFYLSYKYMAAVFKSEKRLTMQHYHRAKCMEEACRMLRSTICPISEISALLGFADVLYFSRCFKAHTGFCPSEYRKNVSLKF